MSLDAKLQDGERQMLTMLGAWSLPTTGAT